LFNRHFAQGIDHLPVTARASGSLVFQLPDSAGCPSCSAPLPGAPGTRRLPPPHAGDYERRRKKDNNRKENA